MRIRAATPDDAEAISRLASEFHAYLNALGDPTKFHFNAETYLRDGFGPNPAFVALVAESNNEAVGYLILDFGYDTDRSRRLAYVNDLFVTEACRGHGVGNALMSRAAEAALERGADALWWGVYERNHSAIRFYEKLGAKYVQGIQFMSIAVNKLNST